MKLKKKDLIYPVAFVVVLAIALIYKIFFTGSDIRLTDRITSGSSTVADYSEQGVNEGVDVTYDSLSTETTQESAVEEVSVYICGAVATPGVYVVQQGAILNDVVAMAGGLNEDAIADRINLVYVIQSNVSIYIPTVEEFSSSEDGGSLQETNSGAQIIREGEEFIVWGDNTSYGDDIRGNGVENSSADGTNSDETHIVQININSASRDELMTLPGIGEVTADRIIEYRQSNPFTVIEDIMNVSGIGQSKYNAICGLICV